MNPGFVYIITNRANRVLYTGVTSNLQLRLYEHKNHVRPGFASRYKCTKLAYYEFYGDILTAIAREKQIKNYSRGHKIELIMKVNPTWEDLSSEI